MLKFEVSATYGESLVLEFEDFLFGKGMTV